jgi:hypothetical protein
MRKLTISLAVLSALSAVSVCSTGAQATVARNIDAAINAVSEVDRIGCYRLGETGYHWYNFCVGPSWLYPHRRYCRHGYCYHR